MRETNATATKASIDDISKLVQNNEYVAVIDSTRKASIRKITGIIDRYNEEMDISLKLAIANEIYLMGEKYPNLNIDFICATITHESAKSWDPKVTSGVGAMGLMQVMPSTGAFLAAEEGLRWTNAADILYNPIFNIRLGCRYMNELVGAYEHDGGLAAYNGGPYRAEMWLQSNRNNNILYAETRDYVPAVLKLYKEFQAMETL